jgi:hypothetical protein
LEIFCSLRHLTYTLENSDVIKIISSNAKRVILVTLFALLLMVTSINLFSDSMASMGDARNAHVNL